MAEEADDSDDRLAAGGDGDEGRVLEWEIGLPGAEDLTPLNQSLIPPELASAFSITPEPPRTMLDVHRASQHTVSNLRSRARSSSSSSPALKSFHPFPSPDAGNDRVVLEGDDPAGKDGPRESYCKARGPDASPSGAAAAAMEEASCSAQRPENSDLAEGGGYFATSPASKGEIYCSPSPFFPPAPHLFRSHSL